MQKITLLLAIIIAVMITTLLPAVSQAASCGTTPIYDSQGKKIGEKPIATAIEYGCSGTGDPISQLFLVVVNFMAVGVGIAVVGGIVFGGLRYATADGNASNAQQGITFIVNSVIGLLLFIFMYAIINFLVPGGLFT